jgi:predicted transcriptional regulator of viral defense system
MNIKVQSLGDWVDGLERTGRYSFTLEEVRLALAQESSALKKALQRLCGRGRLVRAGRGFFVVVPLAYAAAGCVPSEWFLSDLMKYRGSPYYVGCLSAAALHGAAHQRPQELQVVVPRYLRDVDSSVLRIRFLRFVGTSAALTQPYRMQTGDIPISTPEWTAIDLIRFQKHYGSIDAAATVLTEMAEVLDPKKLAVAASHEPCNAYLQRLGWMLDFLGFQKLTGPLAKEVRGRKPVYVPLNPSIKRRCGQRNDTWAIIVNEKPEADL